MHNFQVGPPKSKSRLRFRLASKFSSQGKSAVSSLGLVEGNSTNTVNTVEETEYSSNDKKGIEATTTFNKLDEVINNLIRLRGAGYSLNIFKS